ncbi:MAG TPA: heme o synthase [Casimicrobiaceae bacterium]
MTTLALAEVRFRQFLALTKPRVVSLIVFVAMIGMFLAVPGIPPVGPVVFGTLGIALVAGAAAAINCLVEQKIDALMARTRRRPLPAGEITSGSTLVFASLVGGTGLLLLYRFVNPLTMWLTLATFVGYAIIYTVLLKPVTPQNIVIGGASGAMPPVLGWAAVTNDVAPEALLLFLIIFVWTPPHFWSLALYRAQDYAKAGLPMLPVTHGRRYTQLMIVLYTVVLVAVTLLPFAVRMSGFVYLAAALILGALFLLYAVQLYRDYSVELARATFKFSITYLAALFSALLVDHYL